MMKEKSTVGIRTPVLLYQTASKPEFSCSGAFKVVAIASIKLAKLLPEPELSMDLLVAEAVMEFG